MYFNIFFYFYFLNKIGYLNVIMIINHLVTFMLCKLCGITPYNNNHIDKKNYNSYFQCAIQKCELS
jgi:hypothetical protein